MLTRCRHDTHSRRLWFGSYGLRIYVFMEVSEFRLRSKLGRVHSHERILSGSGEVAGGGRFFLQIRYEKGRVFCHWHGDFSEHKHACCYLRGTWILGQAVQGTKFSTVAPNIYASSMSNVIRVTLLDCRILMWLLDFWKICVPRNYRTKQNCARMNMNNSG